jgi:curved DNA-binding protein CbpA
LKNYYELLEIPPTSSSEEIKRAFRVQIARYHPDKVQHLGREFQAMAADRATELTEAYRILSDEERRADYDRLRPAGASAGPLPAAPSATSSGAHGPSPPTAAPDAAVAADDGPKVQERSGQFVQERASRDRFVRKATIDRFRQAFAQVAGATYDESPVPGFDFASSPKPRLFGRSKGPRLLGRFVSRVDADSVAQAWTQAGKWAASAGEEICVILMGTALATARELADAIAEQRRRPAFRGKVTLIPVNSSVWDAHMPTDAPAVAKDLLANLRSSKS